MRQVILFLFIFLLFIGCGGGGGSSSVTSPNSNSSSSSEYISIIPDDSEPEREILFKVDLEVLESNPYAHTNLEEYYTKAIKVTITYNDEIDDFQDLFFEGTLNSLSNPHMGLSPYEKVRSLMCYLPANQNYLVTLHQYKSDEYAPSTLVKFKLNAPEFYEANK